MLSLAIKSGFVWADIAFIVIALILGLMSWQNLIDHNPVQLGLEYDYSIGNIYNFSKWLAVAFMFFALWTHSQQAIHVALAVIFTAVFFDDAFMLHERVNALSSQVFGVSPHHAGAVLLLGLSISAGLLVWMSWHRSSKAARSQARKIVILMACLVLVGGGLDTVQSEIPDIFAWDYAPILASGVGVLEDGLELLIASLVVICARSFLEEGLVSSGQRFFHRSIAE